MTNNKLVTSFMALYISLLSACGGGGNGGGVKAPTPFTSFTALNAMAKPATIVIIGSSQEATYTYDTGTGKITSLSAASGFANGGSFTESINVVGAITTFTAKSALATTISLNTANGDSLGVLMPTGMVTNVSANGQNTLLVFNRVMGFPAWDYQEFGVWETGEGTASGTVGAISVGAETPGASVPTTGTDVFSGGAGGVYSDSAGKSVFTGSQMSATTDFATQTITFATTGTITTTDFVTLSTNSNLNMSGTLTYTPSSNQFTGAVTTVGGGLGNAPMAGSATGKFYGPAAQEMGGTFAVSGGSTAGYIGGFGARR